ACLRTANGRPGERELQLHRLGEVRDLARAHADAHARAAAERAAAARVDDEPRTRTRLRVVPRYGHLGRRAQEGSVALPHRTRRRRFPVRAGATVGAGRRVHEGRPAARRTGSTNTSITPPHTAGLQLATSSISSIRSSRGVPVSSTSFAAAITAPSPQPPPMVPSSPRAGSTIILLPA